MPVSDKYYEFSSRDGMKISGLASFANNSKIVLIFPGLTGQPQHYMFLKFRDELIKNGYDVFITHPYSSEEKNNHQPRALANITTQRHIDDIEDVINHFSKKYEQVYATGHSLSGRMLLFANTDKLSKQALVDPSSGFDNDKARERMTDYYKTNLDGKHYIDWEDGLTYAVGPLVDEFMSVTSQSIISAVDKLKVETLFIKAGDTVIALPYKFHMTPKTRFVEVPNAAHTFWQHGTAEQAIKEIINFFRQGI
ncbi:MAG: alpha/beta hydrolase [Lactobacillus sp.]|jgi:esterase/lipase|nr:alpha/beta hydrolase [Lactobacillus sp.]